MREREWTCENRKGVLSKKSAYCKRNCSYSVTLLSKKKTYSKLNYSEKFLTNDDNAYSGQECNFSIQFRHISGVNLLQLALACKKRSKDISAAERRNWRPEPSQKWRRIPPWILMICCLISKVRKKTTFGKKI
jgi:hypothetical protein